VEVSTNLTIWGAPATAAIVGSLPAQKQGVASSVNDLSREFGSALGIAVLGSVLNNGYRDGLVDRIARLPAEAQEHVLNSIAFVKAAPLQQFGPQGEALAAAAKESFVSGVSSAAVITAVVLTCAAVFALRGPAAHNPPLSAGTPNRERPPSATPTEPSQARRRTLLVRQVDSHTACDLAPVDRDQVRSERSTCPQLRNRPP
jgi:hypothetical protein